MGRLKIIVSVVLIFAVGFLFGSIGSKMLIKHRIEKHFLADEPPGIHILNRLVARLDLSDAQKTAIKRILEESRQELNTYRQRYRPEFRKLFEGTLSKIRGELNEAQKKKLDYLSERLKKRIRRKGPKPPMPPPMDLLTDKKVRGRFFFDE